MNELVTNVLSMISAVASHGLLGLDRTTAITGIAVPAISVIFGVWLTRKWRDKLRVRVVATLNDEEFDDLSGLYCDRVPDYERVPPSHFRAFFGKQYSAKSNRDFKRRIARDDAPVHLLLIADTPEGICGFLKGIYVPGIRSLYVAYLVATRGNMHEERGVTQKLMSALFSACRDSSVGSLVCEITIHPKSDHNAKARLFRHYANTHGLQLRRIVAKYQQPEICSFDAGDCNVMNAELHIAYLNNPSLNAGHSIKRDDYMDLVSAIYKHVYLMSYALAEPQLTEKYRDFLQRLKKSLFAGTRGRTIDLK